MKNLIRFFLPVCFLFSFFMMKAQVNPTFHAIWACDTNDEEIGAHLAVDDKNLDSLFAEVKRILKIPFKKTSLTKDKFRADYLLEAIKVSNIKQDDILVIIVSGHCYFDTIKNKQVHNFEDKELSADAVVEAAKAKNARFTLVIQDCCNLPLQKGGKGSSSFSGNYAQLKKIFLDAKGFVEVYACKSGQYCFSNEYGSFLIKNFIGSVQSFSDGLLDDEKPWVSILEETKERVYSDAKSILQSQTVIEFGAKEVEY